VSAELDAGANLTLSALATTVHVGAHADAPSHTDRGGRTVDELDLAPFIGPCQVMRVDVARGTRIMPTDLPEPVTAPRLLLATGTFPDPDRFETDFASLSPDLVHMLADEGVVLVGIDTPSVDPFDSTDLPTHAALVARDVRNLEGLVLDGVPPGRYELVALPLRLAGFDASPVRAVLRR
jgi:arylformamidase